MEEMKLDPSNPLYNTTRTPSSAPTSTRSPALNTESSISPMEDETNSSLIAKMLSLLSLNEKVPAAFEYCGYPLVDWDDSKERVIKAAKEDYAGFLQGIVDHFFNEPEDFFKKAALLPFGKYSPGSKELNIAHFFVLIATWLGETGQLNEHLVRNFFSKDFHAKEMDILQRVQVMNGILSENKQKTKAAQDEYKRIKAKGVDLKFH
ncbi:MAG TPA: hypothetical protein VLG76_06640 [Rhabdochlamydiaceae bacterium]|nr:hypothetical protein [Rhabdochlamydiaceae bacterium]